MPTKDEKLLAVLLYVLSFPTPLLGPLVIWLIKKDSPFIDYHGREYFNFLISYTIYGIIAGILSYSRNWLSHLACFRGCGCSIYHYCCYPGL